jgi:hypothetical protein
MPENMITSWRSLTKAAKHRSSTRSRSRLMNARLVITSLAPPGVVIQLDGHAAERLAMTPRGSLPYHGPARRLVSSRDDKSGLRE